MEDEHGVDEKIIAVASDHPFAKRAVAAWQRRLDRTDDDKCPYAKL